MDKQRPGGFSEQSRITTDPSILGGTPCIRNFEIPAGLIASMVASGSTIPEIIDDYPNLEREDIEAAVTFATKVEHRNN